MWVYWNLIRHTTWHKKVISNRIRARKSKSTEQYDCKLFFHLDGRCNAMVELSNSTGWDFDYTIKFNASMGEEYCEWFVCGVCGTKSWLHSFLSCFPRDQQAAVHSLLWIEVILANTSLLLNTLRKKISWSRTWSISWHLSFANRHNCSHNRAAKHIKVSCHPRESSLNHSWPSWILPQAIRDLHLSCPWFLAELDYGSKLINISTYIHKHAGMPGYKKHNQS